MSAKRPRSDGEQRRREPVCLQERTCERIFDEVVGGRRLNLRKGVRPSDAR